jgi:threonine dehydrogenase-like Zn-dependent dehydrogenase
MLQLTYVKPSVLEWWDVPQVRLQNAGDAIIRPLAVTRCDIDVLIATGVAGFKGPFALGHETVGEVVEVGDAVTLFHPGDRVLVPFQISCGECDRCRSGQTGHCTSVPFRSSFGMAPWSGVDYGGGLSDVLRVPFADHMLLRQPPNLSPSAAAGITDNVSDAYRSVAPYLKSRPNARIMIVGGRAQGIVLYAVDIARAFGAVEVIYVDHDPDRIRVAKDLGAIIVERNVADGGPSLGPFPITVDGSGTAEGLAFAIRSTEPGGICHRTFGAFEEVTPVPLRDMYTIGVTLHLSRLNARSVMPEVVECVSHGKFHPERIITRYASFEDAAEAMLDPTIKVVFCRDGA